MTIAFDWTEEERRAAALQLRGGSLVATVIDPELRADLQAVTVTEHAVPTREGPARVLEIRPPGEAAGPRPLFINVHGGGFVRPYQERDTLFCAHLARRLDAVILDVDYKLAPEYPFPAALNECYDIAQWAFAQAGALGVDPDRIAMGGHSAGGNLTAAVCLMARRSGAFRFCGQVLDYPFLDGVTPPEAKLEPHSIFPAERLHAFNALYAVRPEVLADPLLSPVLADPAELAGQPPALIVTAGLDPLRFEAQRYAGQLIAAGVDVTVRQFHDCDHGFLIAGQGRAAEARQLVIDWLRSRFDA